MSIYWNSSCGVLDSMDEGVGWGLDIKQYAQAFALYMLSFYVVCYSWAALQGLTDVQMQMLLELSVTWVLCEICL